MWWENIGGISVHLGMYDIIMTVNQQNCLLENVFILCYGMICINSPFSFLATSPTWMSLYVGRLVEKGACVVNASLGLEHHSMKRTSGVWIALTHLSQAVLYTYLLRLYLLHYLSGVGHLSYLSSFQHIHLLQSNVLLRVSFRLVLNIATSSKDFDSASFSDVTPRYARALDTLYGVWNLLLLLHLLWNMYQHFTHYCSQLLHTLQ